MAVTVSFNFSDGQQARIMQARDHYNLLHGTSLNNKQYLLTLIKDAVRADVLQTTLDAAFATAQAQAEAAINTDLQGGA